MSNLTQTELAKVRKNAFITIAITEEMKSAVVEAKLKQVIAEVKKALVRRGSSLEIIVFTDGN